MEVSYESQKEAGKARLMYPISRARGNGVGGFSASTSWDQLVLAENVEDGELVVLNETSDSGAGSSRSYVRVAPAIEIENLNRAMREAFDREMRNGRLAGALEIIGRIYRPMEGIKAAGYAARLPEGRERKEALALSDSLYREWQHA